MFKDCLFFDDDTEFFKRFYVRQELKKKLSIILEFYN